MRVIRGKEVTLYPGQSASAPLVVVNTFEHEGERIKDAVKAVTEKDFSLLAVAGLSWDDDMSPWSAPPTRPGDNPCAGKADEYLDILTGDILPAALETLEDTPAWIGLSGYSLAGLFAVYAMYRTDLFARIASASGSLWYPDFPSYVYGHQLKRVPDRLYFSLGDREAKTGNPYLQPVQKNTEEIEHYFRQQGIHTIFELNKGNHFQRSTERMAKGIAWILD